VVGFHVDDQGKLHPIKGAVEPLSTAHPNPAQVQIDPSGRWLLEPQPGPATLSGFLIHQDGSLSHVVDPAKFVLPFSAIGLAAE
jgi:hypothetical protein